VFLTTLIFLFNEKVKIDKELRGLALKRVIKKRAIKALPWLSEKSQTI